MLQPSHPAGSPPFRDVHGTRARARWIAGMVKDTVVYLLLMTAVFALGLAAIAAVVGLVLGLAQLLAG